MSTTRSRPRVALAHAIYAVLFGVACLVATVPWLVRSWRDPRNLRWARGRMGALPPHPPSGRPVWIHAVSVGEVKAARSLVEALHGHAPDLPVVVSTGTATGHDTARLAFPDLYVFQAPLDLSWIVRRVLRRIRPRLVISLELEVWPAFLRAADEAGIPQVIMNGRVTESSWKSYRRLRWWLPEFDRIALVAAQDDVQAARIRSLGVPASRVHVTGNLKHDLLSARPHPSDHSIAQTCALDDGRPVFVAGSTHDGEDMAVVQAWMAAGGGEACHLVLVPRHVDRVPQIGRALVRLGVPHVLRSDCTSGRKSGQVLLVDTMGELEALYSLASLVFLGGSLVPVGGHNVLEPAAAGCPVLVGPHTESCRLEAGILREAGGLLVVEDGEALARRLAGLLKDGPARETMGRAARRAVESLRGAAQADVHLLIETGLLGAASLQAASQ